MFNTLVVQPIFNLLVLIYALLPGHNFGMAIILFTIVVRLLMWPLVKRQLHHTKAMRAMQPELKRIKREAKGDRQKESMMTMELYKEKGINPFATIGLTLVQFPILIGLYIGLKNVIHDPTQLYKFTYPFIQNMSWIKEISADMSKFSATLFGFVDLTKPALSPTGQWYIPGLILVTLSAVTQYFQSKQLMPNAKDGRSIRQILKDASAGKQADQSEMQAATGKFTTLMIPGLIFFVTLRIPSALSLYWFVSGLIAYIQQSIVLREDEEEMEAIADSTDTSAKKDQAIEGEVITKTPSKKPKTKKTSTKSNRKRRKR